MRSGSARPLTFNSPQSSHSSASPEGGAGLGHGGFVLAGHMHQIVETTPIATAPAAFRRSIASHSTLSSMGKP
jgi:hypothetical protein